MLVGERLELVVGAVLDRVGDPDVVGVVADRVRLHCRRLDEFRGGDADRGDAAAFQVLEIMRTARGARASVGQPFDHDIAFLADRLLDFQWRRAGDRRL